MAEKRLGYKAMQQRCKKIYEQFKNRPEMRGVSFQSFFAEAEQEWKIQNNMSDTELSQYRKQVQNELINSTKDLMKPDEREKLQKEHEIIEKKLKQEKSVVM